MASRDKSPEKSYNSFLSRSNLTANFRKAVPMLMAFFLASVFWLLVNLNQSYQTLVKIPAKFSDVPVEIDVSPRVFTDVEVNVEGLGINLLSFMINSPRDTIEIPWPEVVDQGYAITESYANRIRRDLQGVRLINVSRPDTLNFSFEEKIKRKLPLVSRVKINLKPQFLLENEAKISPDSVLIIGPKSILDTLKFWPTQELQTSNLSEPQKIEVDLLDSLPVIVSPQQAVLNVNPVRYTQVNLDIPVSIVDIPDGKELKLGNHKVKLSCLVPLSEYENLDFSSYKIEFSYLLLDPSIPYILPDYSFLPPTVKILSKNPVQIPYIIVNHET